MNRQIKEFVLKKQILEITVQLTHDQQIPANAGPGNQTASTSRDSRLIR